MMARRVHIYGHLSTIFDNPQPFDLIWAHQVNIIGERVDIHPFNMSIRLKSDRLYPIGVFEGVYEEV